MLGLRKRTRQFFRALFAKMTSVDLVFVRKHLNDTEQCLFFDMNETVQKHCVNVALTVLDLLDDAIVNDYAVVLKAALLHDIGKTRGNFNVLDQVSYVLVRKFSRQLARKLAKRGRGTWLDRVQNAFYVQVHHAELGANIACKAGLGEDLIFLLRNHHSPDQANVSQELAILIQADEAN